MWRRWSTRYPSLSAHCFLPIAHEPLCIQTHPPCFPRLLRSWGLRPLCRPFYRRTPMQARPRQLVAAHHLAFFSAARLSATTLPRQQIGRPSLVLKAGRAPPLCEAESHEPIHSSSRRITTNAFGCGSMTSYKSRCAIGTVLSGMSRGVNRSRTS